jgi:hypothetical protein
MDQPMSPRGENVEAEHEDASPFDRSNTASLRLCRTRGGAMDSVDSRAASAREVADADANGAPARRFHSARACAGAPSENFIS